MLQLLALLALFTLTALVLLRSRRASSALAHLQGPPAASWILGHQPELMQSEAGAANRRWRQKYGSAYRFQSCYGIEWLMLNDPKAVAHVLQGQTTSYHLEESLREFLRLVTGKGIIYADGPDHARQRRLLQPAFSTPFVKGLVPQFAECAARVTKQWEALRKEGGGKTAQINMYEWAESVTMEAIGQTAFGVRFGAIEGEKHELASAYQGFLSTAFSRPTKLFIALQALALHIPPWLLVLTDNLPVTRVQALKAAKASSLAFSRRLIQEKRRVEDALGGEVPAEDRDILSIMTRAGENDVKGKFSRMSEEEIYAQLTTFFVAGYETSCNTLTFALYELAHQPAVQARLHAELADLLPATDDALTHAVLETLPFLQAVVKETLRLHAVVAHGIFKAGRDDVIPLAKPIVTAGGKRVSAVEVRKGQRVFLSFDGLNRAEDVWGEDAGEFRPERWLDGKLDDFSPDQRCGGPYANLSNFGGGPKTCLAWRFAVTELQTFLAVFVHKFRFSVAPDFTLRRDGCHIVVTPTGRGQEERGPWMPLVVEPRGGQVV